MASEQTLYPSARKYCLDGTINLKTDTIKLMLVTSAYTPSASHTVLADVNASPDPEVEQVDSPSNGYTTGGFALTGQDVTHTESPSAGKFDAADKTINTLTATFRYGILYALKTVGAIVNPLISYILYDNTPADVTVSGVDFVNQWSPNGIITN